jgi:hypothetical protein
MNAAIAYLRNTGSWDCLSKDAARTKSIVPSVLSPLPYIPILRISFPLLSTYIIKAAMTIATTIQDMRSTANDPLCGSSIVLQPYGMEAMCGLHPNLALACQAKREKNEDQRSILNLGEGRALEKVTRLCRGQGCGTCQPFSFESHAAACLSRYFALFSSYLFSTPLGDAYMAHQPCDLEPPL